MALQLFHHSVLLLLVIERSRAPGVTFLKLVAFLLTAYAHTADDKVDDDDINPDVASDGPLLAEQRLMPRMSSAFSDSPRFAACVRRRNRIKRPRSSALLYNVYVYT